MEIIYALGAAVLVEAAKILAKFSLPILSGSVNEVTVKMLPAAAAALNAMQQLLIQIPKGF